MRHSCVGQLTVLLGDGANGRLGTGNTTQQLVPTALDSAGGWNTTAWSAVDAGAGHTCAVRASGSRIFCWGNGGNGRLGTGNTTQQLVPTALDSAGGWDTTAWSAVTAGNMHTCAIRTSDSRIFCWGDGGNGRLGTGNGSNQLSPVALNSVGGWDTTAWNAVMAGSAHNCAIRASDNRIFCWGINYATDGSANEYSGELGNGNNVDQNSPVALDSEGGWHNAAWDSVSGGGSHTCAIMQ